MRGSTVVLAPHAVTLKSPVSHDFWTRLAAELAGRGYTVCTNSRRHGGTSPGDSAAELLRPTMRYRSSTRSGI